MPYHAHDCARLSRGQTPSEKYGGVLDWQTTVGSLSSGAEPRPRGCSQQRQVHASGDQLFFRRGRQDCSETTHFRMNELTVRYRHVIGEREDCRTRSLGDGWETRFRLMFKKPQDTDVLWTSQFLEAASLGGHWIGAEVCRELVPPIFQT